MAEQNYSLNRADTPACYLLSRLIARPVCRPRAAASAKHSRRRFRGPSDPLLPPSGGRGRPETGQAPGRAPQARFRSRASLPGQAVRSRRAGRRRRGGAGRRAIRRLGPHRLEFSSWSCLLSARAVGRCSPPRQRGSRGRPGYARHTRSCGRSLFRFGLRSARPFCRCSRVRGVACRASRSAPQMAPWRWPAIQSGRPPPELGRLRKGLPERPSGRLAASYEAPKAHRVPALVLRVRGSRALA